jgi:pyroglutamyl-peptidase
VTGTFKRILVSGFEAFGTEPMNPTTSLMDELKAGRVSLPAGADIRAVVLPVTFNDAYPVLEREIASFDPDVVIAFGLAGGRDAVEFERVAINCMDADIADNNGFRPRDLAISEGGENALFATLPVRRLMEVLKASGVPSRISNTAGLYVCNNVMYRLLEANLGSKRLCGFVHVPFLPEQTEKKSPPVASLPLETLTKALNLILKTLADTP